MMFQSRQLVSVWNLKGTDFDLSFYSAGSVAGLKLQESLKIRVTLLDSDDQEAKPCADESSLGI